MRDVGVRRMLSRFEELIRRWGSNNRNKHLVVGRYDGAFRCSGAKRLCAVGGLLGMGGWASFGLGGQRVVRGVAVMLPWAGIDRLGGRANVVRADAALRGRGARAWGVVYVGVTGVGGWLIGDVVCVPTALGGGGGLASLVVTVVVAGLRVGLGGYGYGGTGLVGVEGEVEGEGVGGLDRGWFLDSVDPCFVLFSPFFFVVF